MGKIFFFGFMCSTYKCYKFDSYGNRNITKNIIKDK